MKLKPWKLEDEIKTKLDLMEYLKAGLEEGNFNFALIACRDFLEIAEKKNGLRIRTMAKAFKIKGFEEYYATDSGCIYSRTSYNNPFNRIKRLKPSNNGNGYVRVALRRNGCSFRKYVHRIVAETFIPNPNKRPQVNHKNGIKDDNRVENLEWVTNQENTVHAFSVLNRHGSHHLLGKTGVLCRFSKPVLQIRGNDIVAEFCSTLEAQRKTGIDNSGISRCCRGIQLTSGGFQWKYKE